MRLFGVLQEQGPQEVLGGESAGPMPMGELPDFIQHHIGDAKEIEFAGGHWSLEPLSIDPIHIGSLMIDLSPTRQMVVMVLVALLPVGDVHSVGRSSPKGGQQEGS